MRRGLMGWDPDELPQATLAARLARLQAAMTRDGLDAYLIYTNLVRPSAVSWLTGFTPYWIDSILLVRRDGVPVLATALSKRVADWIRSTSWLDEIINTPKPGTAIGQRLAAAGAKRVGVLELDGFPAGFYDDLTAAAPSAELGRRDRDLRRRAPPPRCRGAQADRARRRHRACGARAGQCGARRQCRRARRVWWRSTRGSPRPRRPISRSRPILRSDRRLIRVSGPLPLAPTFAVRASVAYKGSWVRRTRTFARDVPPAAAPWRAPMPGSIKSLARSWATSRSPRKSRRSSRLPGAELKGWMAESCVGSYPLEVIAASGSPSKEAPAAGTFLVLSMELIIDGVPWLGAAPVFVGGDAST